VEVNSYRREKSQKGEVVTKLKIPLLPLKRGVKTAVFGGITQILRRENSRRGKRKTILEFSDGKIIL
jgi:hypothetical protein